MNQDTKELRKQIDGSDSFMSDGHQIIKPRLAYNRRVPDWVEDDGKFKSVLFTAFPKMFDPTHKHRLQSGRWARVFYLYYRSGNTAQEIADEMGLTRKQVNDILMRLRRVADGKSANGTGSHGRRRGRPRKIVRINRAYIPTALGSTTTSSRGKDDLSPVFRAGDDSNTEAGTDREEA